jgi:hypothetical protein
LACNPSLSRRPDTRLCGAPRGDLREVYDEVLRWNRWWPAARDCGRLLCWGSDPVLQTLDGQVNYATAAFDEFGLDNSPMYDDVPFSQKTHILEIADVGLAVLYVADCDAERSSRLLTKSWESERAVYQNYNAVTGRGNDVRSSDAYYYRGALLGVLPLLEKGS